MAAGMSAIAKSRISLTDCFHLQVRFPECMHITVSRDPGSLHAIADPSAVSLRRNVECLQCYTTHASCVRTRGRRQRPCIASRERFVLSKTRLSSQQGWNRARIRPAGIYVNGCLGFWTRCSSQKWPATGEERCCKILVISSCWGLHLQASPGPILDLRSGCGPNRQVALLAFSEHMRIMYDLWDV